MSGKEVGGGHGRQHVVCVGFPPLARAERPSRHLLGLYLGRLALMLAATLALCSSAIHKTPRRPRQRVGTWKTAELGRFSKPQAT